MGGTLPFALLAGAVGLSVGSFLNVAILRWPLGRSVLRPASHCDRCDTRLPWHTMVPVLSWLVLGGRCRACRAPVTLQYPLVELAVGLAWFGAVAHLGAGEAALRAALFATLLTGVAVSDARFYLIPDAFSLGGFAVGIAVSLIPGGITAADALLGAATGFLGFSAVGWTSDRLLLRLRPGRLHAALAAHDAARSDAVARARAQRLAGPGGRAAALATAAALTLAARAFGPPGAVLVAAPVALVLAAAFLAWVESFGEATFTPELQSAETQSTDAPAASSLGAGDVRTMALIGAFTGVTGVLVATLAGSLLALVAAIPLTRGLRQMIPLGVFLAAGGALAWALGVATP